MINQVFVSSLSKQQISQFLFFFLHQEIIRFNLRWKRLLVLMAVWACFVLLQIFKVSNWLNHESQLFLLTTWQKTWQNISRLSHFFLLLFSPLLQNDTTLCSPLYWVLNTLQASGCKCFVTFCPWMGHATVTIIFFLLEQLPQEWPYFQWGPGWELKIFM